MKGSGKIRDKGTNPKISERRNTGSWRRGGGEHKDGTESAWGQEGENKNRWYPSTSSNLYATKWVEMKTSLCFWRFQREGEERKGFSPRGWVEQEALIRHVWTEVILYASHTPAGQLILGQVKAKAAQLENCSLGFRSLRETTLGNHQGYRSVKPGMRIHGTRSPVSAVCPWRETQTDLGCSSPFQPCPSDSERASTASRSHRGEIQTWPVSQENLFYSETGTLATTNRVAGPDLNRPVGFVISPFPSGEQQTHNLLNIIARPKDEVHLLCATYNILQESEESEIYFMTLNSKLP